MGGGGEVFFWGEIQAHVSEFMDLILGYYSFPVKPMIFFGIVSVRYKALFVLRIIGGSIIV